MVLEELAKNGYEHVTLDGHGGQLGSVVREEDVRLFFQGFKVDKVSRQRRALDYSLRLSPRSQLALIILHRSSEIGWAGMSPSRRVILHDVLLCSSTMVRVPWLPER